MKRLQAFKELAKEIIEERYNNSCICSKEMAKVYANITFKLYKLNLINLKDYADLWDLITYTIDNLAINNEIIDKDNMNEYDEKILTSYDVKFLEDERHFILLNYYKGNNLVQTHLHLNYNYNALEI